MSVMHLELLLYTLSHIQRALIDRLSITITILPGPGHL